jgi:(2R)-3-sulfolactate dehydrogenase (NADP+)
MKLAPAAAEDLVRRALAAAGANAAMAAATACALVAAEAQGQARHGLSRVPQYAAFLRNGRADGSAVPAVVAERGGAALVDARDGLAYPALDLALAEAARRAPMGWPWSA